MFDGDPDELFVEGALLDAVERAFCEHERLGRPTPYLVLLNPANHALLGWDEVQGLPVLPDSRIEPMRCRLVSGTKGWAGFHAEDSVYWHAGQPHMWVPSDDRKAA